MTSHTIIVFLKTLRFAFHSPILPIDWCSELSFHLKQTKLYLILINFSDSASDVHWAPLHSSLDGTLFFSL